MFLTNLAFTGAGLRRSTEESNRKKASAVRRYAVPTLRCRANTTGRTQAKDTARVVLPPSKLKPAPPDYKSSLLSLGYGPASKLQAIEFRVNAL
ncbi:unnamed protein product [Dicrocoelium dendriticum]|nr:unnamed protein product [Dicrocoelium dendriticum]